MSESNVGELFQPTHLVILLLVCSSFLIPVILFVLTLQKALLKCAPACRTIEPVILWLYLVPLVGLVFQFLIAFGMAKTLGNEFRRRGMRVDDPIPGQSIGLAMSICGACSVIPFLGILAMLAHVVLWIIYWVKMTEYSRMLDFEPVPYLPANPI